VQSTQKQENARTPERWNSTPVPPRVAERAYERVDETEGGCWISRYSTASHGYAQIGWQDAGRRSVVLAHRAAWVHVNGQMPLGMTLDHLCKERRCVNPAHLRMLPNFENARRTNGRDWPLGTCVNGHDHTHLIRTAKAASPRGYRMICGTCQRDRRRQWDANNRDRRRQAQAAYRARKKEANA